MGARPLFRVALITLVSATRFLRANQTIVGEAALAKDASGTRSMPGRQASNAASSLSVGRP